MFETDMAGIAARRLGRIVFGSVLIAGAIALIIHRDLGLSATQVMLGSWAIALGLGVLVGRMRRAEPDPGLAKASHVVPAIGVSLMSPLLVHLPFVYLGYGSDSYDAWVGLSVVIVGPAHVAFAIASAIRASQLVDGKRALSPGVIVAIVIGVSCLPFAILMFIPPLLVALTSVPLVPLLFYQERLVIRDRVAEQTPHVPRAVAWAA